MLALWSNLYADRDIASAGAIIQLGIVGTDCPKIGATNFLGAVGKGEVVIGFKPRIEDKKILSLQGAIGRAETTATETVDSRWEVISNDCVLTDATLRIEENFQLIEVGLQISGNFSARTI